jgi:hypothetical protein
MLTLRSTDPGALARVRKWPCDVVVAAERRNFAEMRETNEPARLAGRRAARDRRPSRPGRAARRRIQRTRRRRKSLQSGDNTFGAPVERTNPARALRASRTGTRMRSAVGSAPSGEPMTLTAAAVDRDAGSVGRSGRRVCIRRARTGYGSRTGRAGLRPWSPLRKSPRSRSSPPSTRRIASGCPAPRRT